ncbi:MAG: adenosylcobinamide-GDP ribazoletransferase [Deltaproteobacteria bacterium]|nr:MAG: adenosylcobinamide-GDP ribazoletransferase [Deltaproteobacteria bacterium]
MADEDAGRRDAAVPSAAASADGAAAADAEAAAAARRRALNAPAALLAQLATAVRFLTVVPVPGSTVEVGTSALFFPLVGFALGAVLVALDRVTAPVVPLAIRDVLLVGVLVVITGGLHLDGLADAADGLFTGHRERALTIMREGAVGPFGVAAVVLVVALKLRSLDALPPETRTAALLYAPLLARWAMVVLGFGSQPAQPDGLGHAMVRSLTFREFAIATVFALWIVLAQTGARGLLAILLVAATTIGCRILAHARLGGVTGDVLGAIGEVVEALVFAVFALGAH